MKTIESDEELRKYIPNVFATALGEVPLYNKLLAWLEAAERWVAERITGDAVIGEACADRESELHGAVAVTVVSEAFRNAVPSLDLVLTPNGFGIVSNANVAPASKERIERLLAQFERTRDDSVSGLVRLLPEACPEWLSTPQCDWFASTLFPTPEIAFTLGHRDALWQRYQEIRERCVAVEEEIAGQFISSEYMQRLRDMAVGRVDPEPQDSRVLRELRAVITVFLRTERLDTAVLVSVVDFIRSNPDGFPLWHTSETAKLYRPPVFKNKKQDHGYFF